MNFDFDPGETFVKLKCKNANESLIRVDPFILKASIDKCCGTVKSLKKLRDGSILIKTCNKKQIEAIKNLKIIQNIEIEIAMDNNLNKSKGTIRSFEAGFCSEENLINNLKSQNVTEIQRFTRRDGTKTSLYFVTFSTLKIPENIYIGYECCKVEMFIPKPLRCFKCLKYGHSKTKCRSEEGEICNNCGDKRHETDLDSVTKRCLRQSKCVNCSGDHSSLSQTCPTFIKEKEICLIKVKQNISYYEAKKIFFQLNPINRQGIPSFAEIIKRASCTCVCKCNESKSNQIESNQNILKIDERPKISSAMKKLHAIRNEPVNTDTEMKPIETEKKSETRSDSSKTKSNIINIQSVKPGSTSNEIHYLRDRSMRRLPTEQVDPYQSPTTTAHRSRSRSKEKSVQKKNQNCKK